jgi:hypothetical protein
MNTTTPVFVKSVVARVPKTNVIASIFMSFGPTRVVNQISFAYITTKAQVLLLVPVHPYGYFSHEPTIQFCHVPIVV